MFEVVYRYCPTDESPFWRELDSGLVREATKNHVLLEKKKNNTRALNNNKMEQKSSLKAVKLHGDKHRHESVLSVLNFYAVTSPHPAVERRNEHVSGARGRKTFQRVS